jgi:hypothetical protein
MATINGQDPTKLGMSTTVSRPTQTEQAFGLAGEDTALSYDEYLDKEEEEYERKAKSTLDVYLADLEPEDAAYQKYQLSQLPTNEMLDIIYDEDRDAVNKYLDESSEPAREREIALKSVPRAIAPYVRVVAKGAGFVVVKPLEDIEPVIAEGVAKTMLEHANRQAGATGELRSRELTIREKHRGAIANVLEKTGVASNRHMAISMAEDFVGDPSADSVLGGLGAADITPLGALYAFDEAADEISALNKREDVGTVDYIAPVAVAGLSALEAFPVTKGLVKAGKRVIMGKGQPTRTIDEIRAEVDADIASGAAEERATKARNKYDLGKARAATEEVEKAKKEAARKAASDAEGTQLAEDIILEYENELRLQGVLADDEKITRKVFGKTAIDYEKAKNVGKSRLDDLGLPDDEVSTLGFGPDGYRMAILNPDMMDRLVAVVKEIQQKKPGLIKAPTKNKGIMRQLFDASIDKNTRLMADDDFIEALDKYGLSIEDFMLQANASVSYAAKVMNRASQMSKNARKSQAQIDEEETMEALKEIGGVGKGFRRLTNVMRGALVGTVATAMRNFEGFLVRRPMEGLSNIFENAIHAVATKGVKGLKPGTFKESYKKSPRILGEMLRDRKGIEQYTDFILERKEFEKEFKQMFSQVNEIRIGLGRGEYNTKMGQGADYILSKMEDYVHLANYPNRMQEFLARRTAFLSKLETLTKREYGIDLIEAINSGRIEDLMRSNTEFIGKGKRNFNELVGDAVESAMDQTYANGPKNDVLKQLLYLFNKTPGGAGTLVLPFPRFMFKAMEYMYETTLGLPTGVVRRMAGMGEEGGKFVTKQGKVTYNAQMMSRGLAGWTAIGGMTMAARSGLITDDNKIVLPGGKKLDVTYQFPLGQLVFMGQMLNKALSSEKDFVEWWDGKQARDLFLGVNFRGNTGLGQLMDDAFLMFQNELKAGKGEKTAEAMGQFVADRLLWIAQPYQQIIDLERATGFRDTVVRDYESDPTMSLSGSLTKGFQERLQQRGYTTQEGGLTGAIGELMGMGMDEDDRAAPIKQKATKEGGTDRGQLGSAFKFALGLNIMDRNTDEQAFFKKYGYNDWDLASRTGVGTVDNAVNETLSGILPSLAHQLMNLEERFESQGKSDTFIKKEIKARIKQLTNEIKSNIYQTGIKAKGADDPAYVQALFNLRTYNAEAQAAIQERYYDIYGEYPDLTKTEDVKAMAKIGQRGRYKKGLLN